MRTCLTKQKQERNKEVFNLREAGEYINVSYTTIKKILASGELPFRRVGRRILVGKKALDEWVNFAPAKD